MSCYKHAAPASSSFVLLENPASRGTEAATAHLSAFFPYAKVSYFQMQGDQCRKSLIQKLFALLLSLLKKRCSHVYSAC